jgi:hypothetical protein
MHAQGARHPYFKDFFKRAEAAWQCEEGFAAAIHLTFALTHVAGDDELLSVGVGDFYVNEVVFDQSDRLISYVV